MGRKIKILGVLALLGVIGITGACSAPGTPDYVRSNFSPELHTTAYSFEENRNRSARSRDLNMRMFWDDIRRTILRTDRPSRLSPHPLP